MSKQQTSNIGQHEPTKNLVEGLPVKQVSKSLEKFNVLLFLIK